MFGGSGVVKEKSKKSESSKFLRIDENVRRETGEKMLLVCEGKREQVVFATFEMSTDHFDFVKAVAEDNGLKWKEEGGGLDSTLVITKPQS